LESNEEDTYKFMKDDWESRLNKLKEYRPYVPPSQQTPNNKINKVPKKNNEINTNKKSNNNNDDDDLPPPPKPIDRKFFYGEEKKEEKDETINWCCKFNTEIIFNIYYNINYIKKYFYAFYKIYIIKVYVMMTV